MVRKRTLGSRNVKSWTQLSLEIFFHKALTWTLGAPGVAHRGGGGYCQDLCFSLFMSVHFLVHFYVHSRLFPAGLITMSNACIN